MTAITPQMALRYPTGSDAPCDGGQQIIDLRDDIFARLDTFADITARQSDLPMVSVSFTGTQAVPLSTPIFFDTVEQDDIRAADLITDSTVLILGQPGFEGVYLTGFMVRITATRGVYQSMTGGIDDTENPFDQDSGSFWQRATDLPIMCGSTLGQIFGPTEMQLSHIEVATQTVTFARMWAVRIGSI